MKQLSRLTLALYLAALLAPLVHNVFVDGLEERACERCEARSHSGPVFGSRCDGSRPCEDPDHHHHHRHHVHGQCPICQHAPVAALAASRSPIETLLDATGRSTAPRTEGSRLRRELCHNLARAPPPIS